MTVSEAPAQTLSELARLGARLIILDWLAPCETYEIEVVEIVDHGARIFALIATSDVSLEQPKRRDNLRQHLPDSRRTHHALEAYLDPTAAQAALSSDG